MKNYLNQQVKTRTGYDGNLIGAIIGCILIIGGIMIASIVFGV